MRLKMYILQLWNPVYAGWLRYNQLKHLTGVYLIYDYEYGQHQFGCWTAVVQYASDAVLQLSYLFVNNLARLLHPMNTAWVFANPAEL